MHLSSLSYKKLNAIAPDAIALLPLGAYEQHGPHLSVSTDTALVTAVAERAERQLEQDVVLLPTLPFGSSDHHLYFGGTVSVSVATYTQMVTELVESLLQSRFRRIVLLNGHGGNITPVKQVLSIVANKKHPANPNIALATYWELGGKFFSGVAPMESPALSHACEYETSMMLHVYPERVFPEEIARAKRPASNGYIAWEDDEPYRGVTMVKPTENISSNGSSGEPQLGTAEKGQHLIEQAVKSLVTFLREFKQWPFAKNLAENI